MNIIFQGNYNVDQLAAGVKNTLRLFKERYQIQGMREVQLSVTLLNSSGEEVELVDNITNKVFSVFQIVQESERHTEIKKNKRQAKSKLSLVVDNTRLLH